MANDSCSFDFVNGQCLCSSYKYSTIISGLPEKTKVDLNLQTNTTTKFQVATVAKSPADAALASWIANGNFLVVLAMGPIFVRKSLKALDNEF